MAKQPGQSVPSSVQLDLSFCNNMPGRASVVAALNKKIGEKNWSAVDHSSPCWQNDEMTLVIALDTVSLRPVSALALGLTLGAFAVENQVDEMHDIYLPERGDGVRLVRFWWD